MAYLDPAAGAARSAKRGAHVANTPAATAAAAAGATPTDAEFDLLLADVNALRTTVNALLASLRTAGLIASS